MSIGRQLIATSVLGWVSTNCFPALPHLPVLHRFYIVTYALAIYNLNLLLGFLSPQVDPELEGPTLPSKSDEEFRPFVRKLPEFKFWCGRGAGTQGLASSLGRLCVGAYGASCVVHLLDAPGTVRNCRAWNCPC